MRLTKAQTIAEIKKLVRKSGASMDLALLCRQSYMQGTLTLDEIETTVKEAKKKNGLKGGR